MAEADEQRSGFAINELPRDVLVTSMGLLGALDLSRAGTASRLFLLVACEVQKRPELVIEVGSPEDVLASVGQRLVSTPTMGFLFGTGDLSTPGVAKALAQRLPVGCQLVGASTDMLQALVPSVAAHDGEKVQISTKLRQVADRGQMTLMLGSFPDANVRAFHLPLDFCQQVSKAGSVAAAAKMLSKRDIPTGDEWKTIVLLPCQCQFDPMQVLKPYQRMCPNAAIIGGVAGDQLLVHTFGRTRLYQSGVAGLAMRGEVPLTALVSRGCKPLTAAMLARGAQVGNAESGANISSEDEKGDCIFIPELVSEGATMKPIEVAMAAQQKSRGHFGFISGVRLTPDGGYSLEQVGPSDFTEQGSMRVPIGEGRHSCGNEAGASVPHCEVRFFELDPDACKADLERLLRYVRTQCEESGDQVLGSIMFTCGGRQGRFFGEDCADAKRFQEAFPSVPLVGFWAGGEIGPQALAEAGPHEATRTGNAAFQGFTAVFGIFRVPKPSCRTSLAMLGDDQVPQEVGSTLARLSGEAKERGNAAFRDGEADHAIFHYTRAIKLATASGASFLAEDRATLFSNRAAAFLRQSKYEAALEDATSALRTASTNVKAHYRKALALVGLRRCEEAITCLRAAIDLFPGDKALSALLAKTLKDPQ